MHYWIRNRFPARLPWHRCDGIRPAAVATSHVATADDTIRSADPPYRTGEPGAVQMNEAVALAPYPLTDATGTGETPALPVPRHGMGDCGRGRRGQIVIMFALLMVVLFGMVGIAIDIAHARSVAEDVEAAAQAAALAGAPYLPEAAGSTPAETTAMTVAGANGFPNGGDTSIVPTAYSDTRRLKVTITTKVTASFLNIFGLGSITVSRSAIAGYADPIEMGAPDHVLGYASFPTNAFNSVASLQGYYPQGFYLEARGTYSGLEHGDAFSPYFETTQQPDIHGSGGEHLVSSPDVNQSYNDPCGSAAPVNGVTPPYSNVCRSLTDGSLTTLVPNPYYNQQNGGNGQKGYSYVFTLPPNMPADGSHQVLLKVLDPLDECALDSPLGLNNLPTTEIGTSTPITYTYTGTEAYLNSTAISPTNTADGSGYPVVSAVQAGITPVNPISQGTEQLDQCVGGYVQQPFPTTLEFQIFQPSLRAADNTAPATPYTTTTTVAGAGVTVGVNPIYAGPDFQAVPVSGTCGTSDSCTVIGAHAFQWLTIGKAYNSTAVPVYIRVTVQAVYNSAYYSAYPGYGNSYSTTFGQGGNVFALGLCDIGSVTSTIGTATRTDSEPDPGVYGDIFNPADWEPADPSGLDPGKNCPDPNLDTAFTSASRPVVTSTAPIFRFQVNARDGMCIITLSNVRGNSSITDYIPLAELGPRFAGTTVTVRLFDAGDVTNNRNFISILGPGDNPSDLNFTTGNYVSTEGYTSTYGVGFSYKSEPYHLDILAPPNTQYSNQNTDRPPWWCGKPGIGNADYDADNPPAGRASWCPAFGQSPIDQAVEVSTGSSHAFANDVWLEFQLTLPPDYGQTITSGKDWWKVAYNLTNPNSTDSRANDTTTWQVANSAAPVQLLTGQ